MTSLSPLSKSEAARYMGIKGEPDENIKAMLDRLEPLVREKLRPMYVYRETDISFSDDGVMLEDIGLLLPGNDIKTHLKGCCKAVLFAATVSAEADKLIRQAAVTDMAESLALDCLCSAAIEQVCDAAEREIFPDSDRRYRTWRFSPGYGDMPITVQRAIINALNAQRRIGLTVTDSSLLVPSKSVTAVIGISEKPLEKAHHGCEICNMKDRCGFRKQGRACSENE